MAFSQMLAILSWSNELQSQKNKKLALNSGIQTYQILTNDDEVSIPSLSSIFLSVISLVIYINIPTGYTHVIIEH